MYDDMTTDEPMSWQQDGLAQAVTKGLEGQTREGFKDEVQEWVDQLKHLQPYDENGIRSYLNGIDYPRGSSDR